ncbi:MULTISPECIES: pyridoxal phosphate-dependent aminotransferase [unclassified Streptomyces]|uniref:pyridoxal phosphate-dependent aminotransferase n=1 Tax=unclassified Streptomyces TaxID=2593676 RepID=UPI0036E7F903
MLGNPAFAPRALTPPRSATSATVALGDTVARLRAEGRTIINLGSGDPDFATPGHIVEAGVRSLREGRTHYAPSRGIPALLEAIAADREARTGIEVAPGREVVTTPSAKYALTIAVSAIAGVGEPVMILAPSWVSYVSMVTIAGAEPCPVPLDAADGFRLTRERLEAAHRPGARMIIVNSPNNPTGRVFDAAELEALAGYAQAHDVVVLSDEIYEDVVYDGPQTSIASLPGMAERTVVVSGFSKAFAMTGWRLGYVVAPPALTDRILAVHQHTSSCVATFVQDAGVAALTGPRDVVREMTGTYRQRLDVALRRIGEVPQFGVRRPEGAFYLLVDVSRTPVPDSTQFATWALERTGVSLVPGASFGPGADRHVRLALTTTSDVLLEAVDRLAELVSDPHAATAADGAAQAPTLHEEQS